MGAGQAGQQARVARELCLGRVYGRPFALHVSAVAAPAHLLGRASLVNFIPCLAFYVCVCGCVFMRGFVYVYIWIYVRVYRDLWKLQTLCMQMKSSFDYFFCRGKGLRYGQRIHIGKITLFFPYLH